MRSTTSASGHMERGVDTGEFLLKLCFPLILTGVLRLWWAAEPPQELINGQPHS